MACVHDAPERLCTLEIEGRTNPQKRGEALLGELFQVGRGGWEFPIQHAGDGEAG